MITCACGARFEVDDTLAGQEVLCPDCQHPLQTPAAERPPQFTSGWALASVILALVGAFTVFGTLLAVVLGIIGLVSISRHRQQVSGAGFAVFGICLGVAFTALTLFALNTADVFGLETWLRQQTLSQNLDTSGPLEIILAAKGCAITRPTEKWGQLRGNLSDDPAVSSMQRNLDLLLMQIQHHAFLDVRQIPAANFRTLDQCQEDILGEFETGIRPDPFNDDEDDPRPARVAHRRNLGKINGAEVRELEVDARCARQKWHFLIRLYRRGNGPIYVVRAYTPTRNLRRMAGLQDEMRTALESFRLLRP